MTDTTILWILGTAITVVGLVMAGLFAMITSHTRDCKVMNTILIRVDTNMSRLMGDMGDNEHGIRGQVTRHESLLGEHSFRIEALDKVTAALAKN